MTTHRSFLERIGAALVGVTLIAVCLFVVAPPTIAQQPMSVVSHGNGTELIVCDKSVAVNITSATTTALVALVAGQTIYVCGASLHLVGNATAVTATFEYGTGAACTSPTTLTGPYTGATASTATTPVNIGANLGIAFKTAASNALCILSAGTAGINGTVSYAQF